MSFTGANIQGKKSYKLTVIFDCMLMRDRRMCENNKYGPRTTLFDFYMMYISLPSGLSIRARSSSLSASTYFGCPFFVDQRVVSI